MIAGVSANVKFLYAAAKNRPRGQDIPNIGGPKYLVVQKKASTSLASHVLLVWCGCVCWPRDGEMAALTDMLEGTVGVVLVVLSLVAVLLFILLCMLQCYNVVPLM